MQLNFTGRKFEVTPALKDSTTEKFDRLVKRFTRISKINIVFQVENATHIAEAMVDMNGSEIHATAKSEDMYDAVDSLIDKLQVQLAKLKDKMTDHRE